MRSQALISLATMAGGTLFSFTALLSLVTVFAPEIMMAM